MSDPAFDVLLERLASANVRFVLIGGFAVNAWGVVRGTKDLDIVVDPDRENLKRIAEVAVEIGGRVQAADALMGTQPSIVALLAEGERAQIDTMLGPLDIVQGLPGVPSYDQLRKRAIDVDIAGAKVAVCSLADLREMKRAAGRTRDLADLEDLEAAHENDQEQ